MNTPKAILLGLLFAGASLALGSVAHARRATVRSGQVDAVTAEIARAQATAALTSAPRTAILPQLGL